MSKEIGVIALGIWVFILPFVGVPGSWKGILLMATGVALAMLGFFLRAETMGRGVNSPRAPFRDSIHDTSVGEENQ